MRGLVDSTLREGGQSVGVALGLAAKIKVVRGLRRLGVEEIELGQAAGRDPHLPELIRLCRSEDGGSRSALWSRCHPEDIKQAAILAPDVLSLSIPVSDCHIMRRLGRSRAWILDSVRAALRLSGDLGFKVISLGLEDVTRADLAFVEEVAGLAAENGAHRLRLADTLGIASPDELATLVRRIRKNSGLELAVHTHNDFGMATANAIAALDAGADWADATVLGIGERAGAARLEELAAYLALRRGRNYTVRELGPLCRLVAKEAAVPIAAGHPVVGEKIFSCETGLHLQGLLREAATYEPYAPELVGARRRLLFGRKIGRRAVLEGSARVGLSLTMQQAGEVVSGVRDVADSLGRPLGDHEFYALLSCYAATGSPG